MRKFDFNSFDPGKSICIQKQYRSRQTFWYLPDTMCIVCAIEKLTRPFNKLGSRVRIEVMRDEH